MEIVWSPERIGEGRRFRIIVNAEGSLSCTHSDTLVLLDRTPTASQGPQHRLYFRAAKPTEGAEIRLSSGGATEVLRVPVIAEAEWESKAWLGEIPLPRIWPLDGRAVGLKTRHTIVPPEEIGAKKDAPPECPELEWSDDELWGLEPPCDIPRWHFLNLDKGCPLHGMEIYHSDPYYPWIVDVRNRPYQVQCPVGGEWYPTNDYLSGDHTGGEFPDDGWGCHAKDGAIFGFISYYLLRRIRFVYGAITRLANYFQATGDGRAARKVAILLASLAREHRYLSFFPEHRFRRYEEVVEEPSYRERKDRISYSPRETKKVANLGGGSGMDDYCINMPYHYSETARAYDLIFDHIDGDAELVSFLRTKLSHLSDGPAIRRYIETFHFRNAAQAALDDAISSNLPRPQMGLLDVIRVLDRPECGELTEWLIEGGGQVGRMPANFYYKDGAAYESTGGYVGIHVTALIPIVEGLRALRRQHPALYSDRRFDPIEGHERYPLILQWPLEIVVAQLSYPFIGDTGGIPDTAPLAPMPVMSMGHTISIYESAVQSFPENRYFRAALEMLKDKEAASKRAAAQGKKGTAGFYGKGPEPEIPPDPRLYWPSRLLDGYGVGILESGEGANRRGLWLYYGDHPGHSHEQPMDMGLFAHRRNLMRHMGYPYSWQHMDTWDASWITHFGVKVVTGDGEEPWWRSTVRIFHGHGGFQIVQALGHGITRSRPEQGCLDLPGHRLRRALCLVDLPDGRFYAVDFFRVDGGTEHWWTFHGLPGAMRVDSPGELRAQSGGTVAGQSVAYGETPPKPTPKSLAYLYDVRRGPAGTPWSATWELEKCDGLALKITQVWPKGGELVFARGRSPHAPADNPPYELDWVLRHRRGKAPFASEFISVIEADTALPVASATPLRRGAASGVKVAAADLTHWVLRTDSGANSRKDGARARRIDGDVRFDGQAGFVEVDGRGIRRMTLVGEGTLTWRGSGILHGAPDWRGRVAEVDAPNRRIVIHAESAPPARLVGEYLLVNRAYGGRVDGELVSSQDSFAYRVEEVAPAGEGRWECRVNWSPLIGDGKVGEHTETGFRVPGQMPLTAARVYYRGAYVLNHDRSVRVKLNDARGGYSAPEAALVVAPEFRGLLADGFPPGSAFVVEEIGVGDGVTVHGWTEVSRQDDGSWNVRSNGPAQVNLV